VFLPLPPIRPLAYDDGEAYELTEPLRWREPDGTLGEVEAGFVTDLASVPRPLRAVLPTYGRITPAAIRHDRRCDDLNEWHRAGRPEHLRPHLDSVDTDREFLAGLRQLDPSRPVRALAYWAGVRVGAWGNPARRDGWRVDVWRVLAILPLVAVLYLPVGVATLIAQTVDGLVNRLACRFSPVAEVVEPDRPAEVAA
jgi:hypothetical protein